MTTGPDLVVHNAEVFTPAGVATSIAVTGGRITSVSASALVDTATRDTEVVDAGGSTLLPGFTDAHVHPLASGVQLLTCNLAGLPHDLRVYQDTIARYAAAHPDDTWVHGNGWYGDTFPGGLPTRQQLDEVVADRPVVLVSHDGHGVWANSRALELAGIDDRTPDPPNGRINRGPDGSATGVLVERAGDLVTDLLPPLTDAFVDQAMLEAQRHLHSVGVTGWQDACVGPLWGMPDPLPVYLRLADRDQLTARAVGALWWEAADGLAQLPRLRE